MLLFEKEYFERKTSDGKTQCHLDLLSGKTDICEIPLEYRDQEEYACAEKYIEDKCFVQCGGGVGKRDITLEKAEKEILKYQLISDIAELRKMRKRNKEKEERLMQILKKYI